MTISSVWTQCRPPKPSLTEANLPSQAGKVFIVSGGNAGVGFELVKMLYEKGARVYIASRSKAKSNKAIEAIKSAFPSSSSVGELRFLHLQLDDLSTIKQSAEAFKAQESKLDVLWNNAGISQPPVGSKSPQGYELHMATNCLGPYLFTTLLLPELRTAAKANHTPASTRVVWTSSMLVDTQAPPGGIVFSELDLPEPLSNQQRNYAVSKAGNWFLASELNRRESANGIVSITLNPGNLKTDIWSSAPAVIRCLVSPILHAPIFGAYTELWGGLSDQVKVENGGGYAIPWGRWHPALREDLVQGTKTEAEGGSGNAAKFWTWCEQKTTMFG